MKKLIFSVILIILSGFTFAQSGEKNFIDQPYIDVSGTAEMEIIPDMIYLRITINETDTKGKVSLEVLENKMKQRLVDLGIDVAKDLSVEDLSSNYIKYFLKEKDVVASREYVLLVHDASTAGKAVKALSEENISNISLLNIDHSQMAQKRFDLRLEALKTAKVKAEAMAESIWQSVGKAIYITENNSYLPYTQSNSNMLFLEKGIERDEPELSFKTITIKSSVAAKFILN